MISKRQDQLKCDTCSRWQHRTCQSGISRALYWQRHKSQVYQWNCVYCNREGHIRSDAENGTGNYNTQGNDLNDCLNIYYLLLDYLESVFATIELQFVKWCVFYYLVTVNLKNIHTNKLSY